MRTSSIVTLITLQFFIVGPATAADADSKSAADQSQRIHNVENGLRVIVAGAEGPILAAERSTLADRMESYRIPGVSIAVIEDFKIVWTRGYGSLKAGGSVPVTTESIFQTGSTSKLVVSVIALHYVETGALDLDADVNAYLKSWTVPENEFTKGQKVTLRLLLEHRAGMPSGNIGYDKEIGVPTLVQFLKGESPATNPPAHVELVPGSQWQYSNIGYDVVQLLLEDVTGKPLTQLAEEVVFAPLGMNSSTFVYPLRPEDRKREAMPHNTEGATCEPELDPSAVAQGGLLSTPTDLAVFNIELMRAYRGESERLLSPAMARQLFQKAAPLDPAIFGLPSSFDVGEGLGVFLRYKGEIFSFVHPGHNYPGTTCWLEGCPDTGNGVIIVTNGNKGDRLAFEILAAVIDEYEWPIGQFFPE
ncbi:MAG TPA: serine hydrolase domain-containing protein [Acidobacteriota bacterium]|nr:serine hydrolase domain-containing protein [Acidobacteriota bacterium]